MLFCFVMLAGGNIRDPSCQNSWLSLVALQSRTIKRARTLCTPHCRMTMSALFRSTFRGIGMPWSPRPLLYCTFLEMCEKKQLDLTNTCLEMPSVKGKDLQKCGICPAYTFLSATEKKRHMSIVHPTKPTKSQQPHSAYFVCKNKIPKNHDCGLAFPSSYNSEPTRK